MCGYSDLIDYIRYENVSVTIPASARYIDAPLSYICNYVRSVLPVNGDGLTIVQSSRLESKKSEDLCGCIRNGAAVNSMYWVFAIIIHAQNHTAFIKMWDVPV